MRTLLPVFALLAACRTGGKVPDGEPTPDTGSLESVDADGDGFFGDEDCDDGDASVSPAATEVCDGIDNDCDGEIDEGVTDTWYADADQDSYGDPSSTQEACDQPEGAVATATDGDDTSAEVNPTATERCNGVDDDCDGDIDEEVQSVWYLDADGDGFGDPGATVEDCDPPSGAVDNADDCDDGAAAVHPDADEICNGIDDDCDGDIDQDATDAPTWYLDADGDGYGDTDQAVVACEAPAGAVANATDCDDADFDVNPSASEVCNGIDDDCDGLTDDADASLDANTGSTWYADGDADGFGDATNTTRACTQPSGFTGDATDCDDSAAAVNPAATEACNSVDDDCDGLIDDADASLDAATASSWYADSDSDGFGDATQVTTACVQPSGTVSDATDCNDAAASINPGETEICNSVDDDCDGLTDDDDTSLDTSTQSTWYDDSDGDGFGDAGSDTDACAQPSGTVADDSDCDDTDASVNPGAQDVCNGDDDNCDGDIDEEALDGMILISVDTNDGRVYEVDPTSGTVTTISTLAGSGGINTVAVSGSTVLGNDFTNRQLTELDVCNGTRNDLTGHGTTANTCGIVFGPGGRLFGIDSVNDELVEYSPSTGALTVIGSLGFDLGSCGLSYDCTNDVLIGADGSSDQIFKVNTTTGAAYDFLSVGFDFRSVGLEFDPVTQSLLASTRADLYEVDPSTGSSSFIGTLAASNIDDLIYHPECN